MIHLVIIVGGAILIIMAACCRSYHHLLAMTGTCSTTANTAVPGVVDPVFTRQPGTGGSNNYISIMDWRLLAARCNGQNVTRANIFAPKWLPEGYLNIWPVEPSSVTLSPPRIDPWFERNLIIPAGQQIQAQATCSGADTPTFLAWLGPPAWNRNMQSGQGPVPMIETRFTATPTPTAYAWSALAALTLESTLDNAVYEVQGVEFQGTACLAARLVFPHPPMYGNVPMRPGTYVNNATGDLTWPQSPEGKQWLGPWGRFSPFEPPQLEVLSINSTSFTLEGRIWLARVYEGMNVTY